MILNIEGWLCQICVVLCNLFPEFFHRIATPAGRGVRAVPVLLQELHDCLPQRLDREVERSEGEGQEIVLVEISINMRLIFAGRLPGQHLILTL